jgi:hypothetical protein
MRKGISVFVLTILVLMLVAGCGTEPVPISDIAIYPGATLMEVGQNTMADELAETIRTSAGAEGVSVEVNLYSLPEGTTWEDVKSFYDDEIGGTDWTPESDLTTETDFFSTIGWSRGSGAGEQALTIGYAADVLGSGAFLLIGLFSE